MLRQAAHALLPQWLHKRLRLHWRQLRRRSKHKLSEADFRALLLDTFGIPKGSVLFVHSSCDRMNLGFPAGRALAILQEAVGAAGTLLFPCTHFSGRAEEHLARRGVFDVRNSVTVMGMLPELARRTAGAVRSLHPTNSVVALGKRAAELTASHPDSIYPCGELSPYYKIVDYNGLIVGLGVSTECMSFGHCIEDVSRDKFPLRTRTRQVFDGRVIDCDGRERTVKTLAAHKRIAWRNPSRYYKRHVPRDICRDMKIDGVDYFVAHSRELYAKMEELTARGITLYLKKAWRS